jgi:WD40 repeat protein
MWKASVAIRESRIRDARSILAAYGDGQPLAHHRDIEWAHAQFQITRGSTILWNSEQPLYCIAQAGRQLAVGGAASRITLLDRASGSLIRRWHTGQLEINSIVIDSDAGQLWCSGDDGTVHAYDIATGKRSYDLQAFPEGRAYELIHFPQLHRLVCVSSEGTIVAIEMSTGEIHQRWAAPEEEPKSIAPAGPRHFAVGHVGGVLRIYDAASGALDHELKLKDHSRIQAMTLDPGRPRLWIMADNSIRHLELETRVFSQPLATADQPTAMVYDPIDHSFVVSMAGGVFARFRVADDGALASVDQWVNEGQRIFFIAIDPGTGELLSADADGALRKWHSAPLSSAQYRGPANSEQVPSSI